MGTQEKRGVTTRSLVGSREVHVLAKRPHAAVPTGRSLWQAAHWALLLLVTGLVCALYRGAIKLLSSVKLQVLTPFLDLRRWESGSFHLSQWLIHFLLSSFLWFEMYVWMMCTHTLSGLGIPHLNSHHPVEASRDMCLAFSSVCMGFAFLARGMFNQK